MQHNHAVRLLDLLHQVRGPQHAGLRLHGKPARIGNDLRARGGIEPDGGLVHQQHGGLVQQRARQFHLAPVAAGELAHWCAGPLCQAEVVQQPGDARRGNAARQPVQAGMEMQVGQDRQVQVNCRLLEHDAEPCQRTHRVVLHLHPHDRDPPRVGHEQAAEDLEQRGLARAVRPQQRDELAAPHVERDAVQRMLAAKAFAHGLAAQRQRGSGGHHRCSFGCTVPTRSAKRRSASQARCR